jgi:GNAT superfamily N-acetyltransferase
MTDQPYVLRQARSSELGTVMDLLRERVNWLKDRGSDQWSSWTNWQTTKIQPALDDGHVWFLLDGDEPVGTITAEFHGDADFWTPEERAESAIYLSKLAVRLTHAGHELGALLTDWAADYGYRRGCKYVRLDAWKSNTGLQAYYAGRGWKHLRTAEAPGRNSGSLFQLPTRPLPRAQRARLREDMPVTVLEQATRAHIEPDVAGNWQPEHVHRGGMLIQHKAHRDPSLGFFMDFVRYRLRFSSGGWQLDSAGDHFTDWTFQASVLDLDTQVSTDQTYMITHQDLGHSCRMILTPVPPELDDEPHHRTPTQLAGRVGEERKIA